ncbi:MAG: hypothetical protein FJ011_24410 [Chloroflexi bacterium]|nr:hypothetical protein [Chloroflexota bacterium]
MTELDLRKQWKHLYAPSAKKIELVDVPEFKFVMIDGRIEPGEAPGTSPGFAEAIGALYSAAYTLKFMSKLRKEDPIDYPVMALEGLWWVEDGRFDINVKDNWVYTLLIMQPDHITPAMFAEALAQAAKKKPSPALARLRLESFREGLCVQTMHLGPYATEPATLERMHGWAAENGYRLTGKHHEIYLGDPRRADPDAAERMKTVLRHGVAR